MATRQSFRLALLLVALVSSLPVVPRAQTFDCRLVRCDPKFYAPVCAADGRSYINECSARCLSGVDANVNGTVTPGLCPQDTICSCANGGTPVCDVTGQTWSSGCAADCASALGPFTDGACDPGSAVPPIECSPGDAPDAVACGVDPCKSDTSDCRGVVGLACLSNTCTRPATYQGATLSPCQATYVNLTTKAVATCNPSDTIVPSSVDCTVDDTPVDCVADPCIWDASPCSTRPELICFVNFCQAATTFLGTRLPAAPCTPVYVNKVAKPFVVTDCSEPDRQANPPPSPSDLPASSTPPSPFPLPSPTPSPEPSPTPSPQPSPTPSPEPSPAPSPEPSPAPSPEPSPTPSPQSSPTPSPEPSPTPSPEPSPAPSPEPSPIPSPAPSPAPSPEPSPAPSPSLSPSPPLSPPPSPSPTPSSPYVIPGVDITTADAQACTCGQVWDPVCGSDDRTYSSPGCATCAGAKVKAKGRCIRGCSNCPLEGDEVCGSNGRTYQNACFAQCVKVPSFTPGACPLPSESPSSPPVACKNKRPCLCEGEPFAPVCGANSRTYPSACAADCDCVDSTPGACPCSGAPDTLAPVCGADRRTYQNSELALCRNVAVASGQPCEVCPAVPRCAAERRAPVCGADGVTYCSSCVAGLYRTEVVSQSYCRASCLPRGSVCRVGSSVCCGSLVCSGGPGVLKGLTCGTCVPGGGAAVGSERGQRNGVGSGGTGLTASGGVGSGGTGFAAAGTSH